jgi:tRNA pseudouridine38-40 synthase
MKVRLTIEYDGTDFVGWQRQLNGRSVQEVLERGLEELCGTRVPVAAAGRTDAGVHALGQVVAFTPVRELPLKAYVRGLNGMLPHDVAVVDAQEVDDAFDPRHSASGKRYRYRISNRRNRSPLRRRTHWELFAPLDLAAMEAASRCLLGRHDFSAFRAADCEAKTAVRELRRLTIARGEDQELVIDFEGTAFLKHMVRNLVGTLVDVGRGKEKIAWVEAVLASRDRDQAGPTAPAQGLTLLEVQYRERVAHGEPDSRPLATEADE